LPTPRGCPPNLSVRCSETSPSLLAITAPEKEQKGLSAMVNHKRGSQRKRISGHTKQVRKRSATAESKQQQISFESKVTTKPTKHVLHSALKRWSNLSFFLSSLLNFKLFTRQGVAVLYVFVMLVLCIWLLASNSPVIIKTWAAYRLGVGFKEFIKFLTR